MTIYFQITPKDALFVKWKDFSSDNYIKHLKL